MDGNRGVRFPIRVFVGHITTTTHSFPMPVVGSGEDSI
jgi:hypothetical protein